MYIHRTMKGKNFASNFFDTAVPPVYNRPKFIATMRSFMAKHDILDNLSGHLKQTIAKAISLATSLGHEFVTPLHLLTTLHQESGSIGSEILKKCGMQEAVLMEVLATLPSATSSASGRGETTTALLPELDENAKRALEKAMLLAYEYEHSHVGTEHLLSGLCECKDSVFLRALKQANITKKQLLTYVDTVLENMSKFPNLSDAALAAENIQDFVDDPDEDHNHHDQAQDKPKKRTARKPTALDVFTTELTAKAQEQNIDPVIGRENEIDRLIHILCRRTKNNPVLVGEPGVGKTAIVEGLAKRIVAGVVPGALRGKRIYALDLALLISGTMYRGEFESRLKHVIDEVAERDDAILFVDELHTIVGAGSNQGTMDAANILKPALARGLLRCIGATTLDEYTKHIVNDPALERRFQSIRVEEPTAEETKEMLRGIKQYYEKHHRVTITPDAVDAAVRLSTKYVHEHFLPDKAIDLLDEAAALVRVEHALSKNEEALTVKKETLRTCRYQKEDAILKERFDEAKMLKEKEDRLIAELRSLEKNVQKEQAKRARPRVEAHHVADVLHRRLGIAQELLLQDEWSQLGGLAKELSRSVVGQDRAIQTLVNALHQAMLRPPTARPLASILFAGPSGVGKTSLAKALAEALYHDQKSLIKLDMSEFSEAHSTAKLLGSPAGYVGHKERNRFLEQLRTRPYAVVLFDELDKAHPDVVKLLLQILDEGKLTDSSGKPTSFQHAVIVMTTNVGAELFRSSGLGFGDTTENTAKTALEKKVHDKLKEVFGASLIARLDELCVFPPLEKAALERIVRTQLNALTAHVEKTRRVKITPHVRAIRHLTEKAASPDFGARAAERLVHDLVTDLIRTALEKNRTTRYSLDAPPKAGELKLIARS